MASESVPGDGSTNHVPNSNLALVLFITGVAIAGWISFNNLNARVATLEASGVSVRSTEAALPADVHANQ